MNALYLSYDGMTDPLGQSQVIPYLTGLSAQHSITLVSFEKKSRYREHSGTIAELLKSSHIEWIPLYYTKNPPVLATLWDIQRLRSRAAGLVRERNIDVIHCRSYITSLVGRWLKKKTGCRFIFDMRGFWADERVEGKLWNLRNPLYRLIYKYFKKKERQFLSEADQVITLTENAAALLQTWKVKGENPLPLTVIPCCADLRHFSSKNVDPSKKSAWMDKLGIMPGDFILGYLGSIGTWYMLEEMLDFFKILIQTEPGARFLFITQEPPSLVGEAARKKNIPDGKILITSSPRSDLPALLSLLTVTVFFIRPSFSKRASSPTKQGEMMSMGIPIICNSGIGDTDAIIRNSGAGIVIGQFTDEAYREAIRQFKGSTTINKEAMLAGAEKFYSLEKGIEKYKEVYSRLKG